jgi:asparagine synthase (glutamine-hydrolysing)
MCGISAIFDPRTRHATLGKLLAMHAPIRHRGPDGEGFLIADDARTKRYDSAGAVPADLKPRVGMAFRRLKILDLSPAASQPMQNVDGSLWIVFNGEIYNFRQLRAELEHAGRAFVSSGDTEVALAAFEEWGEQAFARFEGMWAIVILDLRQRRLVISRDRFGIKPLFWTIDQGALLLTSEIKQFMGALERRPAPNRALVEMYLRGQRYPFVEETFFDGVRSVPPASWSSIDIDAEVQPPQFRPTWSLADFTANGHAPSYPVALEAVEEKLTRAVESHLVSDVRVGALLSGGLDSATLVGLLSKRLDTQLPTFSLGYREAAPKYCELRFVDAMVRRDGLVNHETTLDARWVRENTDQVLWTLEEPPLGMPALAQYRVFQLCAEHGATVVLDGQGSDEITAGYTTHQRLFLKQRLLRRQPIAFTKELTAIARREHRSPFGVMNEFFIAPRFRRSQYDWIAPSGSRDNGDEFAAAARDYGRDASLVNRQLYFDVRWGNVKIILGYGDRSAMAHSIEARVPYFDRAFVELLFTLPDSYKIGRGERKMILRDVARRYVPAEITERSDRMGFGTPDGEMIRGDLWGDVQSGILNLSLLSSGTVHSDRVERFVLDFKNGVTHDYRAVWRLYALAKWGERFGVAF